MKKSWVEYDIASDFSIYNFPIGVTDINNNSTLVSAIGDFVIDLNHLHITGYFEDIALPERIFENEFANDFIGLPKYITSQVRERLIFLFDQTSAPSHFKNRRDLFLYPISTLVLKLPIKCGDYTDFYSSREHATNVGTMFRDPANALLPNWLHLPVAYHGRSSSIFVSGHSFHRPNGQTNPHNDNSPVFGPSKLIDFELEMAFVICKPNNQGESIPTSNAKEHIFGMMLFNDWSARDIQKWEYIPLGPFLSKNFASTISPWIVSLDALESFKVGGPPPIKQLLPYLEYSEDSNYDIQLEVEIQSSKGASAIVTKSNHKFLYWNILQQLAHHTVNGCKMNVGDLCASGTISGPEEGSYGSLLEITWQGSRPILLSDGTERKFIEDGDTVILKGFSAKNGVRVGFGEARATLLPSIN